MVKESCVEQKTQLSQRNRATLARYYLDLLRRTKSYQQMSNYRVTNIYIVLLFRIKRSLFAILNILQ